MRKCVRIEIVFLLCLIIFSGCSGREFLATLGFDTHDYDGEAVLQTYDGESEMATQLSSMVEILLMSEPNLPAFDTTKKAMVSYRDAVLNYMLNQSYSKYTGNIALLDQAKEAYPQVQIAAIIPADDFENTFYTYFGGKQKVKNESTTLFVYLEKVDAYISVAQPQVSEITYHIDRIEETENTYRIFFTCSLNALSSPTYKALIIKREDGSCYYKYLMEYAEKEDG